jgi:hypothetical protein
LISWIYSPQARIPLRDDLAEWVYELPAHTPKGVILQFNFESGVRRTVFGKEMIGGDYWLATPGPSSRFERVALTARTAETKVSAKIQTSNSHEVATTPFVPVPTSLFQKFAAMRRLNVTTTMLCWYFGNYPGLMNKAAGDLLSFEPFAANEDEFLQRLASVDWKPNDVPTVVEAWKIFGRAFENYPLTTAFQYYGPMHNGPVWPLLLNPRDAPLSPTWQLGSSVDGAPWPPSGDRVGECLGDWLSLAEGVELARRMSVAWDAGVTRLDTIASHYRDEPERIADIGVARALGIQFRSGYNILRFYLLRETMFRMDGLERLELLEQVSAIVREELALDDQLLALCQNDSRLGFHSEVEGYLYFPAKIRWRVEWLRKLLTTEVPEIEQAIRRSELLFPEYTGQRPVGSVATCTPSTITMSSETTPPLDPTLGWQTCEYGTAAARVRWAAVHDADALYVVVAPRDEKSGPLSISNVLIKLEPRRLWPSRRFVFTAASPTPLLTPKVIKSSGAWVMRIPFDELGVAPESRAPIRIDVRVQESNGRSAAWRPNNPWPSRLDLGTDNPADLGWLVFSSSAAPASR